MIRKLIFKRRTNKWRPAPPCHPLSASLHVRLMHEFNSRQSLPVATKQREGRSNDDIDGPSPETGVNLSRHFAHRGSLQSKPHNWTMMNILAELKVAKNLNITRINECFDNDMSAEVPSFERTFPNNTGLLILDFLSQNSRMQ